MKTALIIGGGFAGCAMAHQFALAGGWQVSLVEASNQLGAGVRTQWLGGHPFTFGPRHFLTQNLGVFSFLNEYVPLRLCSEHEFLTYVEADKQFYNYPIHEDDIPKMPERTLIQRQLQAVLRNPSAKKANNFEEFWIESVGLILYNKFINSYSKKMWNVKSNTELDTFAWSPKGVTIKSGPRAAWDTALSGYPIAPNGYDDYFDIATADTQIHLGIAAVAGYIDKKAVVLDGSIRTFDTIVSTISPDLLFDARTIREIGSLAYMGRDIVPLVLPVEFALPKNVYFCYYAGNEPYTRLTEYKKLTRHNDPNSTLVTLEYPSKNGRLYPMPTQLEQAKAKAYFDRLPDGVFSIGRAGSYDYSIDIDDCIAQAMDIASKLK